MLLGQGSLPASVQAFSFRYISWSILLLECQGELLLQSLPRLYL